MVGSLGWLSVCSWLSLQCVVGRLRVGVALIVVTSVVWRVVVRGFVNIGVSVCRLHYDVSFGLGVMVCVSVSRLVAKLSPGVENRVSVVVGSSVRRVVTVSCSGCVGFSLLTCV